MSAIVIGDTSGHADKPGAVAVACDRCGAALWVVRENAQLLDQPDTKTLCLGCASTVVAAAGVLPQLALTPEAAIRLKKRRRRLARKLGVPVSDVRVWPPPELLAAAELRSRRN